MPATPTPYSVTSDRQALTVSAAKPKDTFTVKVRNEGVAADTVNVGIDPGDGTTPDSGGQAVDAAWFTVEGEALPVQRALPPGTDVLVTVTVALPPEASSAGERIEYTFRPYVWSAVRPPRETTVHGPPTTLTVEGGKPPPWWRRYWWILAIAALVLLVAVVATLIFVLGDDPEPEAEPEPSVTTTSAPSEPVNEAPVARLDVTPTSGTTFDKFDADWSRSTDDGGSLTGIIDWGDNSNTGPQAPGSFGHNYPNPGDYQVTLIVDDGTHTAKDTRAITVTLPRFDGNWVNTESGQNLDRLRITGFDGRQANVRAEFALSVGAVSVNGAPEGSAGLAGQSLDLRFSQSFYSVRFTIQLQGPELRVDSVWTFRFAGGGEITRTETSRMVRE